MSPARMPDGLPDRFDGPSAWHGEDLADTPELWLHHLSQADIAELQTAARGYLATGRDIGEIDAGSFPLPRLAPGLADLRQTLLHGIGFRVLRGLPSADAVGLLCLREAMEGGDSLLVSVETIFNRMRAERPDLLALLFDPIATDRRGEVPEGMKPFMEIPPLSWHAGHLTVFYQRQYIDSAQRFPDAMRLTPDHVAALDMFDGLANDPALHLKMRLRPGDMQFVYNHGQLHDRTGFRDWPDPAQRRHLLRLWLSLPGDRPLPEVFRQRYGDIAIGDRGGIITADTRLHAPLDA
jgi:hypothetical protein